MSGLSGVLLLFSAGCGLTLDVDPGAADIGVADTGASDIGSVDVDPPPRDASIDGVTPTDAMGGDVLVADAPVVDASTPCGPAPDDPSVVAYWSFDADGMGLIHEEAGRVADGITVGDVTHVPGRAGCGEAVAFSAGGGRGYAEIPPSPAFQLAVGSLELWMKPGAMMGTQGILSRDFLGNDEPGHLAIMLSEESHVVVRLQAATGVGGGDNAVWLCSDAALTADRWTNVVVSFGAPEVALFIDGVRATRRETLTLGIGDGTRPITVPCGTNQAIGIDGNDEPFHFGGYAGLRSAGEPDNVTDPFLQGAIDDVVLRDRRLP